VSAGSIETDNAVARLRVKGGKLFVEKGNRRYDLRGNRIR
jgi:hypothetical protein